MEHIIDNGWLRAYFQAADAKKEKKLELYIISDKAQVIFDKSLNRG